MDNDYDPMDQLDRATMHMLMLAMGKGDPDQYDRTLASYMRHREPKHLLSHAIAALVVERRAQYGDRWVRFSEYEITSAEVEVKVETAFAEEQHAREYGDASDEEDEP